MRTNRIRHDSKLTEEQIRAAYRIYQQAGLSARDIAEQIWEKCGFSSRRTCETSLQRAWLSRGWRSRSRREANRLQAHRRYGTQTISRDANGNRLPGYHREYNRRTLGLRLETCEAHTLTGSKCRQWKKTGSDFCVKHQPEETYRRPA